MTSSLSSRFTYLTIFYVANSFSPHNYYDDMNDRDSQITRCLTCLCEKLVDWDLPIIDSVRFWSGIVEFICTIYRSYPRKHMFGAWYLCGGEHEWFEGFPCLMQLWKDILVITTNTIVY